MTHSNHPGDEPEFTNDKVADMVLHKDDEPVLNDEAGAEAENPVQEWTGEGVNKGDCWFPIHFSYAGKNYTADVQKKPGVSAEYHVTAITPSIDQLPDPYVIAEHFTKEKYDFPVNETYYPFAFGETVLMAIEEGENN